MPPRIITKDELQAEAAHRTVKCHACGEFIRYVERDRVTSQDRRRRFVPCPGCSAERVLATSSDGSL